MLRMGSANRGIWSYSVTADARWLRVPSTMSSRHSSSSIEPSALGARAVSTISQPVSLVNYLQVSNKWIRPIAGSWPLRAFEKPSAVNELLSQARQRGVARLGPDGKPTRTIDRAGGPTRDRIRKILSSALTWGVEHRGDLITANGCKLVTTRRHRRSGRARTASPASLPERALTAEAAERIARALLLRSRQRTWEPHRDAILLRCEFALGMRPEEVAATKWGSLTRPTLTGDWIVVVADALSHGRITGVKTTERSKRVLDRPRLAFELARGRRITRATRR